MEKVFFGPKSSVWQCLFMDFYYSKDIEYCDYGNKCDTYLKKKIIESRISRFIPHFLKRRIYKKVLRYNFLNFKRDTEILFAFTNGFEMYGEPVFYEFIKFLKKEFKNSKFALHFDEALEHCYTDQLPKVKAEFDLLLGFNRYDERDYGVEYYGPICEKGVIKPVGKGEDSDCFYVGGYSKSGRSDLVLSVFKKLSDSGKKCLFFMVINNEEIKKDMARKLNAEYKIEENGSCFCYKNSKFTFRYLPYACALSYINRTKAVLEIVYPVSMQSCTPRLAQAMLAEKNSLRIALR